MRASSRLAAVAAVAALAAAPEAPARVLVTVDEALALAFPGAAIERRTVFLTAAQRARAEQLAGAPTASSIVHPYEATRDGRRVGTAYFDTHLVRTLQETVMVVVDAEGEVARVEVLAFDEPPDYLPREQWYRQFDGRPLDAELDLRRAIRPVTGATLTASATTAAVRRVLALHRALAESAAPGPEPTPRPAPAAGAPPP